MKTILLTIFLSTLSPFAHGQSPEAYRAATVQVGEHAPIFIFEKNENPENLMVIYTKLNSSCDLAGVEKGHPVFEFYWLMNKTTYKPVHPMIQSNIRERLAVVPGKDAHSFEIQMNDLKELRTDIDNAKMNVVASKGASGCVVNAFFKLGPSDNNATMRLTSMYSVSSKTLLPPFRKLNSIELRGVDVKSGKAIRRSYSAK